jgi:hypothetical protein
MFLIYLNLSDNRQVESERVRIDEENKMQR